MWEIFFSLFIFDTCDVLYDWSISLLPPIVLDNLFDCDKDWTVHYIYKLTGHQYSRKNVESFKSGLQYALRTWIPVRRTILFGTPSIDYIYNHTSRDLSPLSRKFKSIVERNSTVSFLGFVHFCRYLHHEIEN